MKRAFGRRQLVEGIEAVSRRENAILELEKVYRLAAAKKETIFAKIDDHKNYSVLDAEREISNLKSEIESLTRGLSHERLSAARIKDQSDMLSCNLCSPLFIWKYISSEQKRLRSQNAKLTDDLRQTQDRLTSGKKLLDENKRSLQLKEFKLMQHREVNLQALTNELEVAVNLITVTESELNGLRGELDQLMTKLSSHISDRALIIIDLEKTDFDLLLAQKYNSALDNASDDSRTRRAIHKQCEDYFNDGKPYKVVERLSSNRLRLARNLEKIDRRIAEAVKRHDMSIATIIIDGNNACYTASNEFIGLSAVRRLAKYLAQKFNVTVVFDSGIRSLLKASIQDIQKNLGRDVTTYMAQSKNDADEYILRLAESNEGTYIVTNDRYADWHDFGAVKDSRIINFMITSDKFVINDLEIVLDIHAS